MGYRSIGNKHRNDLEKNFILSSCFSLPLGKLGDLKFLGYIFKFCSYRDEYLVTISKIPDFISFYKVEVI